MSRAVSTRLRQRTSSSLTIVRPMAPSRHYVSGMASASPLVSHPENRGINPSRYTGVTAVESGWVILLDSDWTLEPHAVERLRAVIESCPRTVRAVRSRVRWDSGRVSPSFMPAGVIGYAERMEWVEAGGGFDSLLCMERAVFDAVPLMKDRRGTVEELYELDLARARRQPVYRRRSQQAAP